jgi:hypothetical protein
MRSVTMWAAVAGVSLILAGTAAAQQQRQRQGGGQGMGARTTPAALLANEDVQKELKLTDEQKEKVKEFAPVQAQARGQRQQGQGRGNREANPEAAKAAEKFVKETLTADQQKRFQQITYQVKGVAAFTEEDVQKELKLTDEQKTKFKALAEDYTKDARELMQGARGAGGNNQEIAQKRQAMTKDYSEKAQGLLTGDQKKAWKELTGAPFELRPRQRRDA